MNAKIRDLSLKFEEDEKINTLNRNKLIQLSNQYFKMIEYIKKLNERIVILEEKEEKSEKYINELEEKEKKSESDINELKDTIRKQTFEECVREYISNKQTAFCEKKQKHIVVCDLFKQKGQIQRGFSRDQNNRPVWLPGKLEEMKIVRNDNIEKTILYYNSNPELQIVELHIEFFEVANLKRTELFDTCLRILK